MQIKNKDEILRLCKNEKERDEFLSICIKKEEAYAHNAQPRLSKEEKRAYLKYYYRYQRKTGSYDKKKRDDYFKDYQKNNCVTIVFAKGVDDDLSKFFESEFKSDKKKFIAWIKEGMRSFIELKKALEQPQPQP